MSVAFCGRPFLSPLLLLLLRVYMILWIGYIPCLGSRGSGTESNAMYLGIYLPSMHSCLVARPHSGTLPTYLEEGIRNFVQVGIARLKEHTYTAPRAKGHRQTEIEKLIGRYFIYCSSLILLALLSSPRSRLTWTWRWICTQQGLSSHMCRVCDMIS